jgi:hypothetical protein
MEKDSSDEEVEVVLEVDVVVAEVAEVEVSWKTHFTVRPS